jgi:tetratricopeptide (TPR) repeat protein
MARHNKKKTISTDQKLAIAERELSKGNPKEALKLARDCYRGDPSQAVRSVLQRSLVTRGKELFARAMHEPARDIVQELSGMTDLPAELQPEVERIRLVLGVDLGSSALDVKQLGIVADQAVLTGVVPRCSAANDGSFASQAQAVREALKAVEAADHARALELINGIDRQSPFSDWKLFVRGFCAFYELDDERTTANWSRLAEGRAAQNLAEALRCARDPERLAAAPEKIRASAVRLQKSMERPEPDTLLALTEIVHRDPATWKSKWSDVEKFVKRYSGPQPYLVHRVAEAFFQPAREHDNERAFDLICETFPAPDIDPNYHRAHARWCDVSDDLEDTEYFWQQYLPDWKNYAGTSATQKRIGEALIYHHLGELNLSAAKEVRGSSRCQCDACLRRYEEEGDDYDEVEEEYRETLLNDAVKFLRASISIDASLQSPYRPLADALVQLNDMEGADEIYKSYAETFPDSLEALSHTAEYFLTTLEPEQAKQYANRLKVLAPRDEATLKLLWMTILGSTYNAISRKEFSSVPDELNELEALVGGDSRPAWTVSTLRAAASLAEGKSEIAEQHITDSIARIGHDTAALLLVDSHHRRCSGNDKHRKALKDKLTKALDKQLSTISAGVMAKYLYECDVNHVKYTGLATHYKQALKYIEACVSLKWSLKHWFDVCAYLRRQNKPKLLQKLLRVGRKQFPKAAHVEFITGAAELDKGVNARDLNINLAIRSFEAALATADQGDLPFDEETRKACTVGLELARDFLVNKSKPSRRGQTPFDEYDVDDDWDNMSDAEMERVFQDLLKQLPPELSAMARKLGITSVEDLMRLS